ncbi:MAG: hypothetical protein ACK4S6_16990 [Roseateles asaccharophilus]|uniref:hypothetical protein n=1 Tax=Roseateles asaccharophilus TaxID=582607 RepID=UPI00391D2341
MRSFFLALICFTLLGHDANSEKGEIPSFQSPPQKYENKKIIGGVVAEPGGTAKVTDELQVGDISKDQLTFWFYIYGPNFHICSMSGIAAAAEGEYLYSEEKCKLSISLKPRKVEIEDAGGYCKALHCGSRAHIGKTIFERRG